MFLHLVQKNTVRLTHLTLIRTLIGTLNRTPVGTLTGSLIIRNPNGTLLGNQINLNQNPSGTLSGTFQRNCAQKPKGSPTWNLKQNPNL